MVHIRYFNVHQVLTHNLNLTTFFSTMFRSNLVDFTYGYVKQTQTRIKAPSETQKPYFKYFFFSNMSWCNLVDFTYGYVKQIQSRIKVSSKTQEPKDITDVKTKTKCKTCKSMHQKHYHTVYYCSICNRYVCMDCYKKGRFLLPTKGSIYSCIDENEENTDNDNN